MVSTSNDGKIRRSFHADIVSTAGCVDYTPRRWRVAGGYEATRCDPEQFEKEGDSRALAYGQRIAEETGGQYIVALNSDEFEKANTISETSFRPQLNSVKLTDDETGGLFGFRFDLE